MDLKQMIPRTKGNSNQHESYNAIIKFYEAQLSVSFEDYCNLKVRLKVPLIPVVVLQDLIKEIGTILQAETTVLRIESPVIIVGDLSGQLVDLLRLLAENGFPDNQQYLFLGGYGNTGSFSLETVILVFVMKALWPNNVHLLRSSNEFREVCEKGGLGSDIQAMYKDEGIFAQFMRVFSFLPVAAVIDNDIICLNGGIGPSIRDFQSLQSIRRPCGFFNTPELLELFWSDPTESLPMFLPSSRGYGNLFGSTALSNFLGNLKLSMMIRSHQPVEEGCQSQFDGRLLTVFTGSSLTAPNANKSGWIAIGMDRKVNIHTRNALRKLNREDVMFTTSSCETMFVVLPDAPISLGGMGRMRSMGSSFRFSGRASVPQANIARIAESAAGFLLSNTSTKSCKPNQMPKPQLVRGRKSSIGAAPMAVTKMILQF